MKSSATGEALLERTGTFTTPGTAGGGSVTITPSDSEVTVGGALSFTFSTPMDQSVSAASIFQPSAGTWSSVGESATVLKCTLQGGVADGATVAATYSLLNLKTAAGVSVPTFTGSVTLQGTTPTGGTVPTLVSPPSASGITGTAGKALFIFSEPMNPSGIDLRWSGAGVDGGKITATWQMLNLGGITLPVITLECVYAGGWPPNTDVTFTLNPGNSGIIKSAAGVPLAQTTGTFRTPEGGPGTGPSTPGGVDCPDLPSAGTDFGGALSLMKEINYLQTGPEDPVFDTARKAIVRSSVTAAISNAPPQVATSATLNRPVGGSVALVKVSVDLPPGVPGLPSIPDIFFLSTTPAPGIKFPEFDTLDALNAAYPNGNYTMTVALSGGGGTRVVNLPLNPAPEPPAPKISNHAALQNFDPTLPLTIQWGAFAGAVPNDSIQLKLTERGGVTAYLAPNRCENIVLNRTDTSHTIPAGRLKAGVTYDLELTFNKVTHLHEADDSPLVMPPHIRGYAELGLLSKTTRLAIGAPPALSALRFTRVFVEDNGVVSLEIGGTLASAASIGIVQGTQDFRIWTETGMTVTKAGLEAFGGKMVMQDPLFLSSPLPHRFYRIIIP